MAILELGRVKNKMNKHVKKSKAVLAVVCEEIWDKLST